MPRPKARAVARCCCANRGRGRVSAVRRRHARKVKSARGRNAHAQREKATTVWVSSCSGRMSCRTGVRRGRCASGCRGGVRRRSGKGRCWNARHANAGSPCYENALAAGYSMYECTDSNAASPRPLPDAAAPFNAVPSPPGEGFVAQWVGAVLCARGGGGGKCAGAKCVCVASLPSQSVRE